MEVARKPVHRMVLLSAIAGFAVVALTVGGNGLAGGTEDPFAAMGVQRPANPAPAPELALPSLDGRTVRIKGLVRGERDWQGEEARRLVQQLLEKDR